MDFLFRNNLCTLEVMLKIEKLRKSTISKTYRATTDFFYVPNFTLKFNSLFILLY